MGAGVVLLKTLKQEKATGYVFAPKYRRQKIYGKIKKNIGQMLRKLCEQKKVEIQIRQPTFWAQRILSQIE